MPIYVVIIVIRVEPPTSGDLSDLCMLMSYALALLITRKALSHLALQNPSVVVIIHFYWNWS